MKQTLIKPQALRPGDTIGIAAPASPFDQKTFERGISVLESMGFRVKVPDDLFRRSGYLAGSDTERAALLANLFKDESIKAIFCARGGFGSMKLLPLIDFKAISARPKILIGFSDITALLVTIYDKCQLVTFHGPVVTTLGNASEKTRSALFEAVVSNKPLVIKPGKTLALNPGHASGPLTGGNLTTLCHLIGTPYEPCFDGHILLLEDRGEAPYRIDRMLSQLHLGHHLDHIAGVILGSFPGCDPIEEVYAIVKQVFGRFNVPILAGFDLGHGTENITTPVGLEAVLDTDDSSLRFQESAVSEAGS